LGIELHLWANSTLIDSTPGIINAWDTFAKDYSFDATEVAHAAHGRRLYDTLKEWCRIDDEEKLQVCICSPCMVRRIDCKSVDM
jgi:beta-phosphoglucomutase-like phosphatase (HAD superfamily)